MKKIKSKKSINIKNNCYFHQTNLLGMCFTDDGYLPSGIHEMTWDDFNEQFSFSPKRKILLVGLKRAIEVLKECGCKVLYINGSFVTKKLEPNDYDACCDGDVNSIIQKMRIFHPVFLDFANGRNSQKVKYGGEFFYKYSEADSVGTLFIDFFQQIRDSEIKKGIVVIKL